MLVYQRVLWRSPKQMRKSVLSPVVRWLNIHHNFQVSHFSCLFGVVLCVCVYICIYIYIGAGLNLNSSITMQNEFLPDQRRLSKRPQKSRAGYVDPAVASGSMTGVWFGSSPFSEGVWICRYSNPQINRKVGNLGKISSFKHPGNMFLSFLGTCYYVYTYIWPSVWWSLPPRDADGPHMYM